MDTSVSLSGLAAAGVQLRPAEAAAIVSEICAQFRVGRLRGIPSGHVIRLTERGEVLAEGPVSADGSPVARAAHLLEDLLPTFDFPPELRTPSGLRLVIARALGARDLPPYVSLDEFCAAIGALATPDLPQAARELFGSWRAGIATRGSGASAAGGAGGPGTVVPAIERVHEAGPLTISDVRRARRATGLTLEEIAGRSRVPVALLRELERGYLRNWPGGLYGRSQMIRYARAAGLDEQVVLQVGWPLLEEAVRERGGSAAPPVPAEQSAEQSPAEPAEESPAEAEESGAEEEGAIVTADALTLFVEERIAMGEGKPPEESEGREVRQLIPSPPRRARRSSSLRSRSRTLPAAVAVTLAGATVAYVLQSARVVSQVVDNARPRKPSALTAPANEPTFRVTPQPAWYSPAFANTGTAMFYHAESGGAGALMRANTDGRAALLRITKVIDDRAQNSHARPSPDGRQIAFDSDRDGERAVFLADADGHHVRRVSGDGFAAVPSWSPDGGKLAFVRAEPDKPRVWNLWTVDLVSGRLERLTSYAFGQPWGGSWFPDGRHIACSHQGELVILDLTTRARRAYPSPKKGQLVRAPAVSPDGRRVIFQVSHDGAWLLNLADGSMRRVLDDPTAEEYTWSADGHRVAFHSPRAGGWGVWVMAQP